MSGASDLECHLSNASPSLRLQPIANLLRAWSPRETKQPLSVSHARDDRLDDAQSPCTSAPMINFDLPSDRCRALSFLDAKLPFVIRNGPGSRNLAALWTAEYLQEHLSGGEHSEALTLNAFEGDEYKAGHPGNRRISMANDSLWWEDWAADRKLPSLLATKAARKSRSFFLEATSRERPFLSADLAALLYFRADREDGSRRELERVISAYDNGDLESAPSPSQSAGDSDSAEAPSPTRSQPDSEAHAQRQLETTRRLLFLPDPSVSAHADVNCHFGFRGTRVEVSTSLRPLARAGH